MHREYLLYPRNKIASGTTLPYAEGIADKTDDAPNGYHHKKRDETPQHDFLAIRLCILIADTPDELRKTPEEGYDRKRD